MGWTWWLLAIIRPNDLTQWPVSWSLAACIVSFDWARAQQPMSAFDCVYCITVTNPIMNVKIIVWVLVVPVCFSGTNRRLTTSTDLG